MSARIRCTVESMNYSACGLRVGDWFEVGPSGVTLPPGRGFCFYAIASIAPMVGGRLATADRDEWLAGEPLVACPDPPENLVMRLTAVAAEPEEDVVDTEGTNR